MKKIILLSILTAILNAGVFKLNTAHAKESVSEQDIHVSIYKDKKSKECYISTYFFKTANSIEVLSKTKIDCKKVGK